MEKQTYSVTHECILRHHTRETDIVIKVRYGRIDINKIQIAPRNILARIVKKHSHLIFDHQLSLFNRGMKSRTGRESFINRLLE